MKIKISNILKTKIALLGFLCLLLAVNSNSQNLIQNGSFEEGMCDDPCLRYGRYIPHVKLISKESKWLGVFDGITAQFYDTFNSCNYNNNSMGYGQYLIGSICDPSTVLYDTISGKICMYSWIIHGSYLGQSLTTPLIIGHNYRFSLFRNNYPVLEHSSTPGRQGHHGNDTAGHNLYGAAFYTKKIDPFDYLNSPTRQHAYGWHTGNRKVRILLENNHHWVQHKGEFIADSAYKYMYLGKYWSIEESWFESNGGGPIKQLFLDSITLYDASIFVKDLELCKGETGYLRANTFTHGETHWYNKEGIKVHTGDSLPVTASDEQEYTTYRYFPQWDAYSDTVKVSLKIKQSPQATIETNGDTCTFPLQLEAYPKGATYYWNTVLGNDNYFMQDTGTIKLKVVSTGSCEDSTSIRIAPCYVDTSIVSFFIPNAFTPNGDNLNNTFSPFLAHAKNTQLQIFNTWGEKLFSSSIPVWDGTFMGSPCQQGDYLWILSFTGRDKNGVERNHVLSGTVYLMR